MHPKYLTIVLGLMLTLTCSVSAINTIPSGTQSKGDTLYVGGSGPGNYSTIQSAIDAAADEDTVFVFDDSSPYIEQVIINKSIILIGENRVSTIIDGDNIGDVVTITADIVNVSNLTIQNSGSSKSGIKISNSANIKIINNIIMLTNEECIRLSSVQGSYFAGNHFVLNNGRGILLDSSNNNIIAGNNFSKNSNDGVAVLYSSSNNNISDNIFIDSLGGVWLDGPGNNNIISENIIVNNSVFGIWSCTYTNNNTMKNNIIAHTDYGIILNNTRDNSIQGNNINNVSTGIHLCYARYGSVIENFISYNDIGIECCVSSDYNLFFHNNFFNNNENAFDDSNNIWDDEYPSGGNFWDDYNGTDGDGDGIGDIPYLILGGDNEDRYPLMFPWNNINHPPDTPVIDGVINGKAGVAYDYSFSSIDIDDDTVYFWIDWGDGCPAVEWIGPHESGEIITISHIFEDQGDYTVSAKAKDVFDAESDWATLEIQMPLNYNYYLGWQWFQQHFPILSRLLNLLGRFS